MISISNLDFGRVDSPRFSRSVTGWPKNERVGVPNGSISGRSTSEVLSALTRVRYFFQNGREAKQQRPCDGVWWWENEKMEKRRQTTQIKTRQRNEYNKDEGNLFKSDI